MVEQTCVEVAQNALQKGYYFGLLVGWLSVLISYGLINLPELLTKRKKLFNETTNLTKYNEGIVTVLDLVAAAKVSPEKASKFLVKFAREMDIEAEVEESSGTVFYRFVNSDRVLEREREQKRAERYN